jgi:hypothetical protein
MQRVGIFIVVVMLTVPLAASAQEGQEFFGTTISLKCSAVNSDQTKLVKTSITTAGILADCLGSTDPAVIAAHALVFDQEGEEILVVERCTMTPVCSVATFGVGSDLETVKEQESASSSTIKTTIKGFRFMSFTFAGVVTEDFGTAVFNSKDTLKYTERADTHTFKLTAKVQGAIYTKETRLCEGKLAVGKALKSCSGT